MDNKSIVQQFKFINFSSPLILTSKVYKCLKTTHSFHLVDPSPWPFMASLGGYMLLTGAVLYMHKFCGGWYLLRNGFILIVLVMLVWWRDVIREATFEDKHSVMVQKNLHLAMFLFIISEVMFFVSFFWAFFHSSITPAFAIGGVWPPKAITTINTFKIPLANTYLLLASGATVTWAHCALANGVKRTTLSGLLATIILSIGFLYLQRDEYINAPFNISDGIYGSCFYLTTGFHGFHVLVGTIALFVSFIRVGLNHFTIEHHFGFKASIWYWHFVDVVWLFLFATVYWWGNS